MQLKILLPFRVFAEVDSLRRLVVETTAGSFGILPNRLDCAAVLLPGVLEYETTERGAAYAAVDEGVMVKTGRNVLISTRRAIAGTDLGQLRDRVEKEFLTLSEEERLSRAAMAKLETGFIRRFAELRHE